VRCAAGLGTRQQLSLEHLREPGADAARAQGTQSDDAAGVGQIIKEHILGLRALLALELGKGGQVQPIARGGGIFKEAEAETLESGRWCGHDLLSPREQENRDGRESYHELSHSIQSSRAAGRFTVDCPPVPGEAKVCANRPVSLTRYACGPYN
jgi:hypothetical protein